MAKTIFSNPKILDLIQKNRRNMSSLSSKPINFISEAMKMRVKKSRLTLIKKK